MWQKTTSKLALVAQMITQVMPELQFKRTILICDSWYAKQEVTALVEQFEHLDIVCNVRKDTVLYELPLKPSGKRGRPKKYGEKLSLEDISLSEQRIGGLLYRSANGTIQSVWRTKNFCLCDIDRTYQWFSSFVFKHDNPSYLILVLCLARSRTLKPNGKGLDDVYAIISISISVEHKN